MAVSADRIGINYYESVTPEPPSAVREMVERVDDEQEEMDLSRLYNEGERYTYLLTVTGKTNNHTLKITPGFNNVTSVEIVEARIPFTEYTIEQDRNTIKYKVDGASEVTITFDTRDYTNSDIVDYFNAKVKGLWVEDGRPTEQQTSPPQASAKYRIRMGEDEDTATFFFYTVNGVLDTTVTPNVIGEGVSYYDGGANPSTPTFEILSSSTMFYPLGICDKLGDGTTNNLASVPNGTITTLAGRVLTTTTYANIAKCPYRYDLIVSDVVTVRCEELDSLLNRGNDSVGMMPLGEFFLSSPAMQESSFQKAIPDRPIAPPVSLNSLTLKFTRSNTGSNEGATMEYKFRGIRWFVKVAIKTLEISSSSALKISENLVNLSSQSREHLTEGFKKLPGRARRIIQGPKDGVSSMVSLNDEN